MYIVIRCGEQSDVYVSNIECYISRDKDKISLSKKTDRNLIFHLLSFDEHFKAP